jgi:hypothetical protein
MLADDGYVELAFASGGLSRVRVGFDESWPAGSRHRDGDVLVRSVRVTGHGLDATQPQDDVDLGFLGMRGALTIFVELGSGIPVAFSGRAEHVGTLTVRLDRAVLSFCLLWPFEPVFSLAPGVRRCSSLARPRSLRPETPATATARAMAAALQRRIEDPPPKRQTHTRSILSQLAYTHH